MKSKAKQLGLTIFFFGAIASCRNRDAPDDLISANRMIDIMTELQIAESKVSRFNLQSYDSSVVAYEYLHDKILKKHGVDSAQYVESYNYYGVHPREFEIVFAGVEDRINAMENEEHESKIMENKK